MSKKWSPERFIYWCTASHSHAPLSSEHGELIKYADAKKEIERLEEEKQELLEFWQAISASAHTRLREAIDHIGECQNTTICHLDEKPCKCIYCKYWE